MKISINGRELDGIRPNLVEYRVRSLNNIKKVVHMSTFSIERNSKLNLIANRSIITGHLRRSMMGQFKASGSRYEGIVGTNLFYARWVEEGTNPHIIRPKTKKALYWKGAAHPVKVVRHPGGKEKPYLIPAFEKEIPVFEKAIEKGLEP